jgi:hypothetical protein
MISTSQTDVDALVSIQFSFTSAISYDTGGYIEFVGAINFISTLFPTTSAIITVMSDSGQFSGSSVRST